MKMKGLYKSYEVSERKLPVLQNLTMEAENQGITVVLGRSGCGKTTLLRLIAGLEPLDSGEIEGVEQGKIGIIFQEPRLMPWLTVEANILFGVGRTEGLEEKSRERLPSLLALTGLTGFEKAYPSQLSGGMQQRAALARALMYEPDFLLMDEPFAALDYFTRKQMQKELLAIHEKEKKGVLFVTHSIDEALTIGTKIVILEDGACRWEYDLKLFSFPRDMLSREMIQIKKEIISRIEEREDETL